MVSYRGNSIYRVWDPEKDQVFHTSDVIFKNPQELKIANKNFQQIEQSIPTSLPPTVPTSDTADKDNTMGNWYRPAKGMKLIATVKKLKFKKKVQFENPDGTPNTYAQAIASADAGR